MSAENVLGNLLEEFISTKIKPYGWVWCTGETLHAIDFCNTSGTVLLQVKNKHNSENSSSSGIREGTSIQKWYRLGTSKAGGKITPVYKWEYLNKIINDNRCVPSNGATMPDEPLTITEDDFVRFIEVIVQNNKRIVSKK